MSGNKILLVEDDKSTAEFIERGLEESGFVVDHVSDGRDGLFHATDGTYGAIILDRMLPGMDGMSILAAIRAANIETPVLILSALGTAEDRVAGLTSGGDDYLVKPFVFAELLARLKLLMRKGGKGSDITTSIACGDLTIDLLKRQVRRGERLIDLQPREYRLLEFLMNHEGNVVTRTMLLEGVWDYHFDPGTNVIDVHVSRLRKKIDGPDDAPLIHTIRGAGYRLGG